MQGKKLKILLVDDEEKFLHSMAERVKLKGYEPFTARSGGEAIEIVRKHDIHVAVVDLRMPDMDGLVTITKLKEICPALKTILLTAYGGEKLKEATEALNATYFEKQDMGRLWEFLANLHQRKLKILLVDDEEKFLHSVAERVKLKGYEPFTARSAAEAIAVAKKHKIHVAVVDLRMPDMDGLVTITKLKEIRPALKTILLTAFGDDKLKEVTEALNSSYFEKQDMGRFWNFIWKTLQHLETKMAAVGMATGGDLNEAVKMSSDTEEKKEDPKERS